jgi:hypothetical protein
MGENNTFFLCCPFQDSGIRRTVEISILYPDYIQILKPLAQALKNATIEVFIGGETH